MNNIIIAKIESIERCVNRIKKLNEEGDINDFLYQDAIVLNLQRACQQAIDLAMYICSKKALGLPKRSREAFALLHENSIIKPKTYTNMSGIVGFRNIAIHEYQNLNTAILTSIIENNLDDFLDYSKQIIEYIKKEEC